LRNESEQNKPLNVLVMAAGLGTRMKSKRAKVLHELGGLIPATPDFIAMLRRVRKDTGMLIVLDEVITLRLGFQGAQELFGIRPDLTATGKIIGGGFPVGAVAGPAEIMSVFDPRQAKPLLPHSGTFNANPITMVAGEVSMRLFETAEIDRLGALGDRARAGVAKAFEEAGFPGQVTGMGSLLRFHVHRRPLTDYRSSLMTASEKETLASLVRYLREHGLFVNDRGVCSLSTPMGEDEVDTLIAGFRNALHVVGGR
jgi:glutamate-1-semialdehyde 2,1-aminomutase